MPAASRCIIDLFRNDKLNDRTEFTEQEEGTEYDVTRLLAEG